MLSLSTINNKRLNVGLDYLDLCYNYPIADSLIANVIFRNCGLEVLVLSIKFPYLLS